MNGQKNSATSPTSTVRRLAAVATLSLILVACGSSAKTTESTAPATDGTTATADTGAPASTPETTPVTEVSKADALYPNGIRNVRYCEIAVLKKVDADFVLDVWNTMGFSECPQADWDAIKAPEAAAAQGGIAAIKNGPRFWTIDRVRTDLVKTADTTTFGVLEMFKGTSINFGPAMPAQTPYLIREIPRDTVFSFEAGSRVYEVTDDAGRTYAMQSYAQIIDPTQTIDKLENLGSVLKLPVGWTFESKVLDAPLEVPTTNGIAYVIQDELQNTYQRVGG